MSSEKGKSTSSGASSGASSSALTCTCSSLDVDGPHNKVTFNDAFWSHPDALKLIHEDLRKMEKKCPYCSKK